MPQATSTASIGRERSAGAKPSAEVAPVAARERALALQQARRDPHDEHGGDEERGRVDRSTRRRARRRRQHAADERPEAQLTFSTPWSSVLARGSSASGTRFGDPA